MGIFGSGAVYVTVTGKADMFVFEQSDGVLCAI